MEKIKPLSPSLREKKRYVAFEILSQKVFTFKQASELILDSALKYCGVKGLAEMGLVFLKEKFKKNKGVIKVSTKNIDSLRASFCIASIIDDKPVILRSLGVSGVLQKMNMYIA